MLENYCKVLHIEALTMMEMVRQDIIPAISKYIKVLGDSALAKMHISSGIDHSLEEKLISKLSDGNEALFEKTELLDEFVKEANAISDALAQAKFYHDKVLELMGEIRAVADEMETYTAKECWPFPTYGDLLFSIQE